MRRVDLQLWLKARGRRARMKEIAEMDFWRGVFERDGRPANAHFEHLFTEAFGLPRDFYDGKAMLDVGCGPTGSLEWATNASERVGLDPLVGEYRALGIDEELMRYVDAPSEAMPFEDESFDVVSTFNSLDHVGDVRESAAEMVRVLKGGGSMLLVVEVNHPPTVTEPASLPWELPNWFGSSMEIAYERRYESSGREWFYSTIYGDWLWDEANEEGRPGVLVARLEKVKPE